jgi:hypothetical protein
VRAATAAVNPSSVAVVTVRACIGIRLILVTSVDGVRDPAES